MRILGRAVFLLFIVLGVLIAISNRQHVEIGLWPFPQTVGMPLFLLVPVLLLLGVLVGLVMGWFGGATARRGLREARRENDRLRREADALREELAGARRGGEAIPPSVLHLTEADQRSLDRQAALVDPDQVVATRRIARAS